jgi:tricorn protease
MAPGRGGGGGPPEEYAVPVDGRPARRLTYWGERFAIVRAWVSDDEVLAGSATGRRAMSRCATALCWSAAP